MEEYGIDQRGYEEKNYVLLQGGDTMDPYLVNTPNVLDNWVDPPHNKNKGKHYLSEVGNPGRRSSFYFQPKFESGRYKSHCLPTGCAPVLKNENGECMCVLVSCGLWSASCLTIMDTFNFLILGFQPIFDGWNPPPPSERFLYILRLWIPILVSPTMNMQR